MDIYIGTYTDTGSKGVYRCALDEAAGTLRILDSAPGVNPAFLTLTSDKQTLLAVWENLDHAGESGGALAAYRATRNGIILLGTQNVRGTFPCHVAISPDGRWAITSNYGDGTHSVVALHSDGSLGDVAGRARNNGTPGPKPEQEDGAHAHSIYFAPGGDYLIACDLGVDRVIVYAFDTTAGTLREAAYLSMPPGTGPRHFVWHPTLTGTAYVVGEHRNTVTRLRFDAASATLSAFEVVPTLERDVVSTAADLHISADGRFVYASNRGEDSIAVFRAASADGSLTPIAHVPCGGKEPRNFCLVPGTDFLLCANQSSDLVSIFRVGTDGVPRATGNALFLPTPTCVCC